MPTKATLEAWRDMMLHSGRVSTSTINTRLAVLRKLLNTAADSLIDVNWKLTLRDWAKVKSARTIHQQNRIEEDYGCRLTTAQVSQLFDVIGVSHIKALRDRAVVALGVGAGLRVSEIVGLTVRDVFFTQSKAGYASIWVLRIVREYCQASGLDTQQQSDLHVIRGVRKGRAKTYTSFGTRLSTRQVQDLLSDYLLTDETETQFAVRPMICAARLRS